MEQGPLPPLQKEASSMGRWGPRGVTYLTPDTPTEGSMRTRPPALVIILGLEDEI